MNMRCPTIYESLLETGINVTLLLKQQLFPLPPPPHNTNDHAHDAQQDNPTATRNNDNYVPLQSIVNRDGLSKLHVQPH